MKPETRLSKPGGSFMTDEGAEAFLRRRWGEGRKITQAHIDAVVDAYSILFGGLVPIGARRQSARSNVSGKELAAGGKEQDQQTQPGDT